MEDFEKILAEAVESAPRISGIHTPMALSIAILRTLEARFPGFRDEVRARIQLSADLMAASDDPEMQEDAPSMADLAESWFFTE